MRLKAIDASSKDGKDAKAGSQATASTRRVHYLKVWIVGRGIWRSHGHGSHKSIEFSDHRVLPQH